jgi:hypothetical protein
MKIRYYIILALALVTLPACDQRPNGNQKDGIKDALDVRPNEGVRDLGEDVGKAAKEIGSDIKDAVKDK